MDKNFLTSDIRNSAEKVFFWNEDQLSKCILQRLSIKPKRGPDEEKQTKKYISQISTTTTISTAEMLFCMTYRFMQT